MEDVTKDVLFSEVYQVQNLRSKVLMGTNLSKDKAMILGSLQQMCFFTTENYDSAICELFDDYKVVKFGGVFNDSVLFALCESGYIIQVCLHTLTPVALFSQFPVGDFVVLEGSGDSSEECSLMALVHRPEHAIVLISWPEWKVKFRMPVQEISFLIDQKEAEDILFLEGFGSGLIDTIRIKTIFESLPDLRLARMLQRYKFEEAEKFARTFNLDLEIVYKAHVQKLMQDLKPWTTSLDTQKQIFNHILDLIKNIQDHNFVAEICASVIPPDFDMLHTMLMYGTERFSKVADKSGANLSELLAKVSSIARRLDTCMLIHGATTSVEHWIEFPKHDLVISCLNHIKRGQIKEAILVWGRHLSDMKPLFTEDKARQLLAGVPTSTQLADLLLWQHHFIPPILAIYPHMLGSVVQWSVERASKGLEWLDPRAWPDSGLTLAKGLLRLVHSDASGTLPAQRSALQNMNLSPQSPLNQLLGLIFTLQDINLLKHQYNVSVQYDQFVEEDHHSFVMVLLEKLPLEKIPSFMEEFFPRLMKNRGLDPDLQILQFIKEIVMKCEDWWFWDEAPWEARVFALVPHLHSIQLKLDAILHVLRSAPVPWTPLVTQLAEQGARLPGDKANDVRNESSNVPRRLIMKEYRVKVDTVRNVNLIRLILKKCQPRMMEDIYEVAKYAREDVSDIYDIVLNSLVEKGESKMVEELLNTLEETLPAECVTRLLFNIHRRISHLSWEKLPNFFTIISKLDSQRDQRFLANLKTKHKLKMEFDITSKGELTTLKERQNILRDYAEKVAKELISATDGISTTPPLRRMGRLAYLLSLPVENAILDLALCCLSNDLPLETTLIVAGKVEDLDGKPQYLYNKLAHLMGLLIAHYKPAESPGSVVELFTEVSNKLALLCLTHTDCSELDGVLRWVSLVAKGSGLSKPVMKSLYGDPTPTPATAVLLHSSIQNILHYYASTCKNNKIPVSESVTASVSAGLELTFEPREMVHMWQRLRESQHDLLCIRLICEYCWSQTSVNPKFQDHVVEKFLIQCVKELLRKLFRMRNFDVDLALLLVQFFGKEEAMEFLVEEARSVGFNYQRLSAISQLALMFSSVNKMDNRYIKSFLKYHISCKWAKKLNELGLPYKDAFKDSDTEHKQLIQKLISLPSTNILLLKEFCLDVTYDVQECLMMYLEYLVLNWAPDIQISEEPATGEKVMVVKNTRAELQQQCRSVLHELASKSAETGTLHWSEAIQSTLYNLWNKVNYYYYEVYFVLADMYQQVLAQPEAVKQINNYKTMLEFLQSYKRISPPSGDEHDQWFQLHPNTNHLPPISNFRLPFTLLFEKKKSWDFIKPELSLKTYKIWYNIVPILGLEKDMLCTLTIQMLTSEQLGGSVEGKAGTWRLQECNTSVMAEIMECVKHINDQEMASAALYWVVNHIPPGADQVAAVTLCHHQTQYWHSQDNSDKSRACLAKVQKKYLTLHTSHYLHLFGLGKAEYLQLVLLPQDLISALYNDPSILQRKTASLTQCPDINKAVQLIGKLHDVNVVGIQQELLSEWLYPGDNMPLDTSCDDITQNIAAFHNGPSVPDDSDNIIRACYVLESMDMEKAAKYLVNYASLHNSSEMRPTSVRLRGLQCLSCVATPDVIVETTGTTLEKLRSSMQSLMFVSELEKLGLVWSLTEFEACDKEKIVRMLINKASPAAVQLGTAMANAFHIANPGYWDRLLSLMTSYTMMEELITVLPDLTYLCHLLDSSIFTAAWNCALVTPLVKTECPLNEESHYRVQSVLEMLYSCPIPRQVDLSTLQHHCQRLGVEEFTVRLQPFLSLTHMSSSPSTDNKLTNGDFKF
ncbi:kinetochore-associated protein 1-like [Macrosteles quadrilineatus]|uniref:kinetochore-associated protein 1-like n=1 Tax=Macrosteles quadrilineatus TaxID=74068 RepID=UPI0023E209BD|nr:kinetochore-associated protein 1-like [Macrosteles quadrilineatus]